MSPTRPKKPGLDTSNAQRTTHRDIGVGSFPNFQPHQGTLQNLAVPYTSTPSDQVPATSTIPDFEICRYQSDINTETLPGKVASAGMSPSPFPPANQVPLHKNPPLAPSQELAYRQKCIDLRRRLTEIEQNNDAMRTRIARERAAHDKMRLNRAILLHHLKNVIDGEPLNSADAAMLRRAGADENLQSTMGYDERMTGIDGNARSGYLDEDTDNSVDEEMPEPQERPLRSKRSNKYNADSSRNLPLSSTTATPNHHPLNGSAYGPSPGSLPQLLPAHSASPSLSHRDNIPSSYQSAVPGMASTPIQPPIEAQPPPSYQSYQNAHDHSPSATRPTSGHTFYDPHRDIQYQSAPEPQRPPNAPERPLVPREAFEHHQQADAAAHGRAIDESLAVEIQHRWEALPEEARHAWEEKYWEEMKVYEQGMDQWKRANRGASGGGSGGGFRAVNQ
ncbi:MAG: hypothetical protein Q9227_003162 [Pyrenula ochraceoflavens]